MDSTRMQRRGPTSPAQIMHTGALLLRSFIHDQLGSIAERALGTVSLDEATKELVDALKHIARDLDNDKALQRLIAAVKDRSCTANVFFHVATQIFSDGITWGRVAALFYFASRLVFKALYVDTRDLVSTIMGWTLDFLRERLLKWIQEQGGWGGLLETHSGSISWVLAGAAMIIGTVLTVLRFQTNSS